MKKSFLFTSCVLPLYVRRILRGCSSCFCSAVRFSPVASIPCAFRVSSREAQGAGLFSSSHFSSGVRTKDLFCRSVSSPVESLVLVPYLDLGPHEPCA
jgi:hypothetical protein